MELIGAFALLGVTLCALFLSIAMFSLLLSMPGWFIGCTAAFSAPRLKSVRRGRFYFAAWLVLGVTPITLSVVGGSLSGAGQFLPNSVAITLGILGFIVLNVSAFFVGYKTALSVKAKREVRKAMKARGAFSTPGPDLLDENHPAIAPNPMATKPLPVVDADRPLDGDAPTQETPVHGTVSPDDEYPTARPHEG